LGSSRRDYVIIGISLANLAFLWVWQMNKAITRGDSYFLRVAADDYLAFVVNVIGLGILFAVGAMTVKRIDNRYITGLAKTVFVLVTLFVLNHIRAMDRMIADPSTLYAPSDPIRESPPMTESTLAVILIGIAVAIAMVLVYRYFGVVVTATKVIVMILFPWALFTLLGSIWFALRYEPTTVFADLAPAGPVSEPAPIAQRVVLLLFDELDQEVAIDERPSDVPLPELDRFRQQALEASQFYPNGGYTQLAIPGILSGRKVVETRPAGTNRLVIRYEGDQEERDWIAQPNLFEAARELGIETAVSGWYHPYCRLFNESLTKCFWMPIWWTSRGHDRGILQSARDQWQYLLPGLGINHQRLVSHMEIKGRAESMAVDEDIDLLFVHYPIPHRPIIYDRKRQRLTTFRTTKADYFDNLVLADHTLGDLRAVMEENGVWDDATVIITADHGVWDENYGLPPAPLNRNDIGIRRVPLLMKLPRQRTRVVVPDSLHASVLHDLLLGLLQGQIVKPEEARDWLKAAAQ
jgi:hypothetical protein